MATSRGELGVDGGNFNENVPNSDNFLNQVQFQSTHCIFCAKECPAKFVIGEGGETLIKVKCEEEERQRRQGVSGNEEDDTNAFVKRQLKSLFIVRKILGVEKEICCKLITQFDGQLHPEYWLNVCGQCELVVASYKKMLKEIAELERRGKDIQDDLKKIIWESNHDDGDENGGSNFSGIWKELREKAMLGFDPSQIQPERLPSVEPTLANVKLEQDDNLNKMMTLIIIVFIVLDNAQGRQEADSAPEPQKSPSPSLSQSQPSPQAAQTPPPETNSDVITPEEPGEGAEITFQPKTAVKEGMRIATLKVLGSVGTNNNNPEAVNCELDSTTENPSTSAQENNILQPQPPPTPAVSINNPNVIEKPKQTGGKTGDNWIQCELCPAKFRKRLKAQYINHSALHKEGGPGVVCPKCKIIVHRSRLEVHKRSNNCLNPANPRFRPTAKQILKSIKKRVKNPYKNTGKNREPEPPSSPPIIDINDDGQPVEVEVVELCKPLGGYKTAQKRDKNGELEIVEVIDLEESEGRESQSSKNSLRKGVPFSSSKHAQEKSATLSEAQSQSDDIEILDEYLEQEMNEEQDSAELSSQWQELVDTIDEDSPDSRKSTLSPQPSSSSTPAPTLPKKRSSKKPPEQEAIKKIRKRLKRLNSQPHQQEGLKGLSKKNDKKANKDKPISISKSPKPSTSKAATKTTTKKVSWEFDSDSCSDSGPKSSPEWIWELDKDNEGMYKCPRCPATIPIWTGSKGQSEHRMLHQKGGPGWPCPCCSIYVHKSRVVLHQRSGKCLHPPPDDLPIPVRQNTPSPPVSEPELTGESNQSDFSMPNIIFDKGYFETIGKKNKAPLPRTPPGFNKVPDFTVAGNAIYKCKYCPARLKLEHAKAHQCPKQAPELRTKKTPAEKKTGKRFPCKYCYESLLSEEMDQHERTQCPKRPGPGGIRGHLSRSNRKEPTKDHYKCKDCSALIRPSDQAEKELKRHFELHKESAILCLVCGWVVDNICLHNAEWHDSKKSLKSNEWALRPNFWVVDDSNPKYLLYKREYVSKYKCNRCPAEYFNEDEIKEHSKLHEENEGDLCTSCDWIVAPGKMKEHEEKHHRSLGSEEFPVSSLLWKQVKYWKCKECQGKLLEEDKEEHIRLHGSGDGATCAVCGLLIKSELLVQHLAYFHPELGFTTYI
ncbi:unnamed protein product [Orchesella dallaii]|uniref:C2H2-type domain-containing protein n=1 Tax=Orchesella dallaii TaxID=48710 RepID=A0ABP1RMN1_9HEXA